MNLFEQVKTIRISFFVMAAAVVAILISLTVILAKNKHQKNKDFAYFKTQLHKIIRNEALEKAINNYSKTKSREYWLIRVTEINKFGEKDHFFDLQKNVSIGRDFNSNNLFVLDEEADTIQCRIELRKETPYIVNVSDTVETHFSFNRKKERQIEKKHILKSHESIRLYNGDSIEFGQTRLVFQVFNSEQGIV
ncbi:MAG: hypothetical protein IKB93_16905 [Clostridia bacterium]|nr:hypothetical protein [Clostridia bacterium]